MSKAAYWQRGETLDYKNTGSSVIEANTIIVFGSKIGIAGMEINPGETGSLHISGTFEFPKATGAIAAGADVYFDKTAGNITTTADSNTKSGFTVAAAAESDTKVLVKINA